MCRPTYLLQDSIIMSSFTTTKKCVILVSENNVWASRWKKLMLNRIISNCLWDDNNWFESNFFHYVNSVNVRQLVPNNSYRLVSRDSMITTMNIWKRVNIFSDKLFLNNFVHCVEQSLRTVRLFVPTVVKYWPFVACQYCCDHLNTLNKLCHCLWLLRICLSSNLLMMGVTEWRPISFSISC